MAKGPAPRPGHPSFITRQVQDFRYFFLNLKPAASSELTVACGGWERCAADYRIDRTRFAFYGIEFVARGRGTLTLAGQQSPLLPGAVFAYGPSTPHTIQSSSDEPLMKYFVDFSGRQARQIVNPQMLGGARSGYLHNPQPVHDLYEQLLATGLRGDRLAARLCAALLKVLALRIEENAHASAEIHSRAGQTFERCRAELTRNFRAISSVSELSRRTHLAPAYLARLFDRFAGESPHEMLTRFKVNEAAAQILGGRFTVKEVAAQVGFSDPYHFSRVFKRHHGIPPTRFQQSRAGDAPP